MRQSQSNCCCRIQPSILLYQLRQASILSVAMQDVIKEVISFAEVGSSDQDKENDRTDGPPTPTQGPAHHPTAHAPSTASFKSTPSRHVVTHPDTLNVDHCCRHSAGCWLVRTQPWSRRSYCCLCTLLCFQKKVWGRPATP